MKRMMWARDRPGIPKLLPLLLAALLLAGGVALVKGGHSSPPKPDAAAVPVAEKGPTEAELQAALQAQTEAASFRFRVESGLSFTSGEGQLNLMNSVENTQDVYVTITLDETGTEVYRSGIIPPGGSILRDRLSTEPAAGSYPATVTAHVLDPETGEELGRVEAAVELTAQP